ncbi:ABC transporter substrate binding protein [Photobacterium atrarenae]|uniref:diguanylate cyclase n=1 Tax=Photobacterium atrarenae TaxID=865757 RepID=A0ABY5GHW3_9GAMM|nr:ABC transporter substrate binding protein [Photobacterium atrarenae]UTV28802.1 diguanylate cyclase [Photobacterium atrarenae]
MWIRFLLVFFWLVPAAAFAQSHPIVLLINSYDSQYPWSEALTRGVKDEFSATIPDYDLHVEYMDERRFLDDEQYHRLLVDLLKYKYRRYTPEIIIAGDDLAYNFMLEHAETLFPGTPVVFSGVNVFDPDALADKPNFTGIQEGMEIQGNLALIRQLQPEVERIVLLGDRTELGQRMVRRALAIKAQWETDSAKSRVQLDIWDDFTLRELNERVKVLGKNTAILMMAIHMDNEGTYFSYRYDLPLLAKHSPVPIYGMWGTLLIGNCVIGGLMNDPYQHGRNATKIAVRILNGTPVETIPVKDKAAYAPVFDYPVLENFQIDLDRLPPDSKIVGKPVSYYEEHMALVNTTVAVVLVLLGIISALMVNIYQRRRAQKQLDEFNHSLETLVERRTQELDARNQELKKASKILQSLAYTDPLTGLGNRRAGASELKARIERRQDMEPLCHVALLDIDFFKQINDTHGHPAGDAVLCAVGQVLTENIRATDRVYRWGGEEFLLLMTCQEAGECAELLQRLRTQITQLSVGDVERITISIGTAAFVGDDSFDSILHRVDQALYAAKHNGRNQVVAF